ncbi:MAG: CoA-binding protein, partial [Candidatus Helarchaeales archaeon]
MEMFFHPESVAILGVSRKLEKDGNNILRNIMLKNSIKVYPINPFADQILGVKVYHSVLDVPDEIDLAIIFVPPDKALKTVEECVEKKVKAILIESSGFNEVGNWELFNKIKEMTRAAGIRVWGPNCTGYVDFHEQFYTTFARMKEMLEGVNIESLKGNVSLISQSGMIAGGMMFEIISG